MLLAVVADCGPRRAPETRPAGSSTVLVVNAGLSPLRIYVLYANQPRILGTVSPGGRGCFVLPWPTRTYNLGGSGLDGGVVSPAFVPAEAEGWIWELGVLLPQDAISLRPVAEPCRAR